jgi:thiol-disulfide isomerase/thioredoxin
MKKIPAIIALAMSLHTNAQAQTNIYKNDRGELVYEGATTFEQLSKEPAFTWLQMQDKASYTPDAAKLAYLKEHLRKYNLVVLMGTWCEDSHMMLPKIYKVLQDAQFPMGELRMYGVNREKKSPGGEEKAFNVSSVPTVIVFKGDKEVGRITEVVRKSVEADLAGIVEKDLAK